MSAINYRKWDHIEISDDEDDTHPNVDTPSLFKWRHEARIQREEKEKQEKAKRLLEAETRKKQMSMLEQVVKATEDATLTSKLTELEIQQREFEKKEAELERYEREHPHWNVDNISQPKSERTIINKATTPAPPVQADDSGTAFWKAHGAEMKQFGMLSKHEDSQKFLISNPHLVNDNLANYLAIWCIDLCVEEKEELMKRVAHQCIVIQYILELAKSVGQDPRVCVPGFFKKIGVAELQYQEAFQDEFKSFLVRVRERAQARIDKAQAEFEEEERKKRLGPGGLDPIEVMESLPQAIRQAFEAQDTPLLKASFAALPPDQAKYHFDRVVASGLWVPAQPAADDSSHADSSDEEFEDAVEQ